MLLSTLPDAAPRGSAVQTAEQAAERAEEVETVSGR